MPSNPTHVYEPIYGWGWRQGDHSIDVPEPFELEVTSTTDAALSGLVRPPHKFAGCNASLSFRSKAGELTHWGVVLSGSSLTDIVTGYAQSSANDV